MKALTACVVFVLSALAAPADAAPLRVLATDNEPFFFVKDGAPAGLEYEILSYFARASKKEMSITWVHDWTALLPMLERAEGDLGSATITVTPERQQRFDFSSSYFPVRVVLVQRREDKANDLKELAGATLATVRETTLEELLSPVPNGHFIYSPNQEGLFEIVASGKARAAAVDSAMAFPMLLKFPTLRMGMPLSRSQELAFVVPKGSPLAGELSQHILRLKASGIYYRLVAKYLGAKAAEVAAAGRD